MNRNTLIIFAAITLTVVMTAIVVVSQQRPPTYLEKESLLPELIEHINDAASITLQSHRHQTVLERDGEKWTIASSDHYPALFDKVRALLIDLGELRTLERKTGNPDLYHRLDVRDPSQPDSNSVQVTVRDDSGNVLADVIIGKPRVSRATNIQTGLYVRMPDARHALLVEGRVPVSAKKTEWFNTDIVDISSARVREVIIRHPAGDTVRAERDQPDDNFHLADLLPDRQVQSQTAVNKFGSVLQEISARDVRSLETFEFPESTVTTEITTFDGLIAEVRSARVDDKAYANFRFRFDPEHASESTSPVTGEDDQPLSVKDQAERLQRELGDWVYQIPGFKFEVLTATLADYTRRVSGTD